MKKWILVIAICLCLLAGCAHIKVSKTFPDGSAISAEYWRLFNQSIEGFKLITPDANGSGGYTFEFARQKSNLDILLELAGTKFGVGGEE